jgi:LytS/YehU family sensor histidine kinase
VVRGDIEIAPLLFISLVENAFKHGVSSSRDSFVNISLRMEADALVFRCNNSNFPKTDKNRSGSGIGLENMRRRLQLIYPGRYTMDTHLDGDVFRAEIKIETSPDPQ